MVKLLLNLLLVLCCFISSCDKTAKTDKDADDMLVIEKYMTFGIEEEVGPWKSLDIGESIESDKQDSYGTYYRIFRKSENSYQILAAGRDGRFGTFDDKVRKFVIPKIEK